MNPQFQPSRLVMTYLYILQHDKRLPRSRGQKDGYILPFPSPAKNLFLVAVQSDLPFFPISAKTISVRPEVWAHCCHVIITHVAVVFRGCGVGRSCDDRARVVCHRMDSCRLLWYEMGMYLTVFQKLTFRSKWSLLYNRPGLISCLRRTANFTTETGVSISEEREEEYDIMTKEFNWHRHRYKFKKTQFYFKWELKLMRDSRVTQASKNKSFLRKAFKSQIRISYNCCFPRHLLRPAWRRSRGSISSRC